MKTVKLSILEMDAILMAINSIRSGKIKFGLRIRLTELENAIKPYLTVFYEEREKMVQEFAERDENGEVITQVNGTLVTYSFKNTEAVNERWSEMTSVTADIPVSLKSADLEDVVGGPEMEVLFSIL